jgi:hypothetical protein
MNSASVDDPVIVGWNLHLCAMVPSANLKHAPPKDLWVLRQVVQSELGKA